MKLTKSKLQQIIKEELENMMGEESSSDHAKAEDFLKKAYSMAKDDKNQVETQTVRRIITHLRDGGESSIGPMDPYEVQRLDREVREKLGIEAVGPIGFMGFDDEPEADPRPYGKLGS
jgi:hypothetical protein